jgi:RNA polymerase sigma-70 factor (ECF subfamily)
MELNSEIIRKCAKGDRGAIKAFYNSVAGWMLGICLRYIKDRNEAMSVVNLSLLAALENLKTFDATREEKIEAWLKTILIRKAIDYLRKNKLVFGQDNASQAESLQIATVEETESRLGRQALLEMINALNPASKAVFNLYAIEGYKHAEIAEMLGISVGTSKWHLSDARKKLQAMVIKAEGKILQP